MQSISGVEFQVPYLVRTYHPAGGEMLASAERAFRAAGIKFATFVREEEGNRVDLYIESSDVEEAERLGLVNRFPR